MSEWPILLRIARKEFSYFFRTKWLMAILLSLNLSDMLVVALVYRGLMSLDYFQFFVPAVVVMGLFSASLDTGRRIWIALRDGMIHYYLSLPISTHGLVAAHLLAGGMAGLVYSGSLLIVAFALLGVSHVANALILLPFLLLLAVGLSGLAAALAGIATAGGEFFYGYQQVAQTLLLIFSTIFYPAYLMQRYLPSPLVWIATMNPLSLAVDGLRAYAFQGDPITGTFMLQLSLASLPFAVLGGLLYLHVLSIVRTKGRI